MKPAILPALALAVFAQALSPSAAFGQDKTGTEEVSNVQPGRHTLDSGELSADFPCAPEAAQAGPTVGQAGLKCTDNGLTFFLATAPAALSDEGQGRSFGSYEENLEGAREDPDTTRVLEGYYRNLRVFDAWKSSAGPVGRARIIELSDSLMGMALVLETGANEIEPNGAVREAAFDRAEAFIASVEVLAK